MRYSRSPVVDSCYRSQSITAGRSAAVVATRNVAATPDHNRCGYCVATRTFRIRSCSSHSYNFADRPAVVSSRIVGLIHNSYRCCSLAAARHECTSSAPLAATTAGYSLKTVDHSIATELSNLVVLVEYRRKALRLFVDFYQLEQGLPELIGIARRRSNLQDPMA